MENDFIDFAAHVLNVPAATLSPATAKGSLPQFDSIAFIRLIMETEARYGFKFTLEETASLETLGDVLARAKEAKFLSEMALCLENDAVSFDTVFTDVEGWCSLMAFSVLIAIEREFSVQIEISRLLACRTIGDIAVLAGVRR